MSNGDDYSIANATELLRRIHPTQVVPDENHDCQKPSSSAFRHYEMSIVLSDRLAEDSRTPDDVLENYPGEFLAGITAGNVRSEEQIVVRSPTQEEPAHGDVIGEKERPRSRSKRLRDAARWVVPPENPC